MFYKQRHTNLAMNPCFTSVSVLSNVTGAVKQAQDLELGRPGFEFWDCRLLTDDFCVLLNLSEPLVLDAGNIT